MGIFFKTNYDEAYFHRYAATCNASNPIDYSFQGSRLDAIHAQTMLMRLGFLSYRLRTGQHFMTASACKWYLEHARTAIREPQTVPSAALPALNAMLDRLQALLDDHVARWGAVNTTDFGRYAEYSPNKVLFGKVWGVSANRGTPVRDLYDMIICYCWIQSGLD